MPGRRMSVIVAEVILVGEVAWVRREQEGWVGGELTLEPESAPRSSIESLRLSFGSDTGQQPGEKCDLELGRL